jgi:hypothetical protein
MTSFVQSRFNLLSLSWPVKINSTQLPEWCSIIPTVVGEGRQLWVSRFAQALEMRTRNSVSHRCRVSTNDLVGSPKIEDGLSEFSKWQVCRHQAARAVTSLQIKVSGCNRAHGDQYSVLLLSILPIVRPSSVW